MGPAGGRICPECGRDATDEDITEAVRRTVYLEATRTTTVVLGVAVPIATVALIAIGYMLVVLTR